MNVMPTHTRQPDHPVATQFPARWSPSASNHQPWRLVWALRDEAAFTAIRATLTGNNPVWAGKAAVLIVVASKDTVLNRDGVEVPNATAGFDTGAAWMSLALQAPAMGLVAHAMGGFDKEALATAVGLPDGHTLHCVVAVGEQGPAEALPEDLQAREKPSARKPLAEVALRGRF